MVAASAAVVITVLIGGAGLAGATDGQAEAIPRAPLFTASGDEPVAPDDEAPTATDNEFWPEDRDIGECLGALERPGCGSDQRGGWRQTLVLGVVIAALALIGWRLVVLVRRRDGTTAVEDDRDGDHDSAADGDSPDNGEGKPTEDPTSQSGV